MKKNILNFIPELQIKPHAALFLYLADLQKSHGDSVYFVSCKGAISRCLVRDSVRGFPQEYGQAICNDCQSAEEDIFVIKGHSFIQMCSGNRFKAKQFIAETILVRGIDALFNTPIIYEDFLLSEVSFSQFFLINKKNHLDSLTIADKQYLLDVFETNLYIYLELDRIIVENNIQQLNLYNEYGQNLAAISAAKKNRIEFNIIDHKNHLGPNRQLINIRKTISAVSRFDLFEKLYGSSSLPLTRKIAEQSFRDLKYSFEGMAWYSVETNHEFEDSIFSKIRKYEKAIGLFTSSIDEFESSRKKESSLFEPVLNIVTFKTQVEWLSFMVKWARENPNIALVVRIHPREGIESRSMIGESTHLSYLKGALKNLPENFIVIWPNDKLSSYRIMQEIDFGIISWSNIGSELARFGVPVLSPFYPNPTYSDKNAGIYISRSVAEFGELLDKFSSTSLSPEETLKNISDAIRFLGFKTFTSVFDLSEAVPSFDYQEYFDYIADEVSDEIYSYFESNSPLENIHRNFNGEDIQSNAILLDLFIKKTIDLLLQNGFSEESKIIIRLRDVVANAKLSEDKFNLSNFFNILK